MKKILQKIHNAFLSDDFSESIAIERSGIYLIEITASAKSWWQNTVARRSFLKKDSLTIRINANDIVEQKKKMRADDFWNGNVLKGNNQTVYVCMFFESGTANSISADFDNDGVNELVLIFDDPLGHEYLTIMIIDQEGSTLKHTQQKIDRQYSGGPPTAIDVTSDAIPEIIVYSTGGRQDVQAYLFRYDAGALHLVQAFERNYLRADFIYSDQNGNHIPEIIVRGEQYGDECMACDHPRIEEVFEYEPSSETFVLLSSKLEKTKETPYNVLIE
ncbi:VCBS repeat-containing protein [Candidatus Uhrbacteria bacterium]|nr:VCBS repeat-containing protein [Candidatus Uhrbacteria bacterium]